MSNFHPLEARDPQLQVGENLNKITLRVKLLKLKNDGDSMLAQSRGRWANIKSTLVSQ